MQPGVPRPPDGKPAAHRGKALGDAVIIEPGASHAISHDPDELCEVIAVLASPDAQIGAVT